MKTDIYYGYGIITSKIKIKDVERLKGLIHRLPCYEEDVEAYFKAENIPEPTIEDYLAGKIPTIEQMYARIDEKRKKEGISYSQTDNAEEMAKKGHEQLKKAEKTSTQQMIVANAKAR